MKKLLALFALSLSVMACSAEAPTPVAKEPKPIAEVKADAPKKEKVCITIYDAKLKKDVEKCRVISKHTKLEKVEPTPSTSK